MSEEEKHFYVAIRVRDMPIPIIPCVRLACSGGCGEEVWVDRNVERIWSRIPVLCMDCASKLIESSEEEVRPAIAPESITTIKKFLEGLAQTKKP